MLKFWILSSQVAQLSTRMCAELDEKVDSLVVFRRLHLLTLSSHGRNQKRLSTTDILHMLGDCNDENELSLLRLTLAAAFVPDVIVGKPGKKIDTIKGNQGKKVRSQS